MKKLKASLAVAVFVLAAGATVASNQTEKRETRCSPLPNGGGGIFTPAQLGCTNIGSRICCYRVADNWIIYKP